jgi:hypothetical protein
MTYTLRIDSPFRSLAEEPLDIGNGEAGQLPAAQAGLEVEADVHLVERKGGGTSCA